MTTRTCKKCNETKDLTEFPIYDKANNRRRHECQDCNTKRVEGWHSAHSVERLAKARARYQADPLAKWTPERRKRASELDRIRYKRLRDQVFERYHGECAACGETEWMFLTLDHINNDGWQQRAEDPYRQAGAGLYKKILRDGMPDDLEILCFNCNFGKRRNGGVLVYDRRRSREGATTREQSRRTKRFEAPSLSQESDDMVSSAGKLAAA